MALVPLITLEQAKAELRVVGTDEDDDIALRCLQATSIILDYLKSRADPTWTLDTVPPHVTAAIAVMLVNRYRRDPTDDQDAQDWEAVERLLMRSRDPALA